MTSLFLKRRNCKIIIKLKLLYFFFRSPRKDLTVDLYDTSTDPHTHYNQVLSTWKGMNETKKVSNVHKITDEKKQVMYPG